MSKLEKKAAKLYVMGMDAITFALTDEALEKFGMTEREVELICKGVSCGLMSASRYLRGEIPDDEMSSFSVMMAISAHAATEQSRDIIEMLHEIMDDVDG